MYDPVKDGVDKSVPSMVYVEVEPPPALAELVHCYWEMKTDVDLPEDFELQLSPMGDPNDPSVVMRAFADDGQSHGAGGALVKLEYAKPGPGGSMVYFASDDCAVQEARVVDAGGQVVRPKFSIGDHGFVSLMMDTEGNRVGLHSMS